MSIYSQPRPRISSARIPVATDWRIHLTDIDYARAEQMLAPYRARLVPQAAVVPQWSDDGARFRYWSGTS